MNRRLNFNFKLVDARPAIRIYFFLKTRVPSISTQDILSTLDISYANSDDPLCDLRTPHECTLTLALRASRVCCIYVGSR